MPPRKPTSSRTAKTRKSPVISSGEKPASSSFSPIAPKRKSAVSGSAFETGRAAKAPKAAKTAKPKKQRTPRNSGGSSRTPRRARKYHGQGRSLFATLFKWLIVLGVWCSLIVGGILGYYATELPAITKSATFERQSSITVLDASGAVLTRYGEIKGNTIDIKDMPPYLVEAVMAIEDRRFYSHFGIDVIGLLRAMVVNAQAGGVVQGGSTITQQLAKNLFLSHERTYKRKVQEAMLALWLEHELTKDEIMTAYLNRVYLGSGTYGVDAASMMYFDKPVQNLTMREAATIAGLLKAPSRYSPRRNPNLANERADVVLAAMADAGYLTKEQAKGMSNTPPIPPKKPGNANSVRYFTDWVVDGLDDLIGTPDTDLIIETTLVSDIQDAARNAVQNHLNQSGATKNIGQAATVFLAHDGAVVALIGGRDYNKSQFNRITQAMRQPGSSFKPVVYLNALQHGLSPNTLVIDEPITTGKYRPENFGRKYYGEVTLQTALTLSLNTVSFQLTKEFGPQSVIETARALGIISPMSPDLSLALGTSVMTPLELATAYAAIANGGFAVFPYAITKIKGEDGKVYYERPARTLTRRVADEYAVRELQVMMQSVVEYGTGQRAKQGFSVGGKTGTSQDSRDAWFAGFSDRLVGVAWAGNDDNSPTKDVTGGSIPAAIWGDVMGKAQYAFTPTTKLDLAQEADVQTYDIGIGGLIGRLLQSQQSGDTGSTPDRFMPLGSSGRNSERDGGAIDTGGEGYGEAQHHESNKRYND